MTIKVGINGFGRIGRIIFRTCQQNQEIELSAINDPSIDVEYVCYLIKFDSTHGKFNGNVTRCDDEIRVDDNQIKIFHEKLPSNVPWSVAGVQYVIEASGLSTTVEKASVFFSKLDEQKGHLQSDTVKRVIITAPSVDVPMVILGVNDAQFDLHHKVISCASSTLYCLAPIIKVLEDNFGVAEGFMTSIHAMTPSLKPLDGLCLKGKHWRDHRSIHQNIIPATTSACKALGKIIPQVKDKISGLAFRIPIVDVSILDLSVRLNKNTTLQGIVNCIRSASNADMKNIIKISNEETVSSDFIGDSHSCILDLNSSLQQNPNFFKLICWYENEYSYACRVVDSIFFSERQFSLTRLSPEIGVTNKEPSRKINEVKQSLIQNNEIIIMGTLNVGKEVELKNVKSRVNALNTKQKQQRYLFLKKPPLSHKSETASSYNNNMRECKKGNGMFKIWNDTTNETSKLNVRQTRNSFFHSCVSFPKQNITSNDCIRTQEHLQNVKREFSKMVDITEDLLKKSYSNKVHLCNMANNTKNIKKEQTERSVENENKLTKNNNERKNKPIFDICGDYENTIEVPTVNDISVCSNEEIRPNNNFYRNGSHYSNSQRKNAVDVNITPIQSEKELNAIIHSEMIESFSTIKIIDDEADLKNNFQILEYNTGSKNGKAINTVIEELTQNSAPDATLHEQGDIHYRALDSDNNDITKNVYLFNNTKKIDNATCSSTDNLDLNDKEDAFENYIEKANNKVEDNDFTTDEYNLKRKSLNDTKIEANLRTSVKFISARNDRLIKNNDMMSSKKIMERLNRFIPEPVFIVPEDKTTVNANYLPVKQNNFDIYDKLDSASASSSEDSFEINRRKSQIIDITDLTTSLDDLANLEKICKIIEISDELSDRLFSNLKDCHKIKNKKWSLKNLCERIKLDEFYDKVFGKTI